MKNRLAILSVVMLLFVEAHAGAEGTTKHAPELRPSRDPCLQNRVCRNHVETSKILSGVGLLNEALKEYEMAYAEKPVPWLLYNMARLLDKMNRFEEAIPYYQRYLDIAGTEDTEQVRMANLYLAEAQKKSALVAPQTSTTSKIVQGPSMSAQESATAHIQPIPTAGQIGQPIGAGILLGSGLVLLATGIGYDLAENYLVTAAAPIIESPYSAYQPLHEKFSQVSISLGVIGGIIATAGVAWGSILLVKRNKQRRVSAMGIVPFGQSLVLAGSF